MERNFLDRLCAFDMNKDFVLNLLDGQWYTYGQIWNNACLYVDRYHLGEKKEIAVIWENSAELLCMYFACMISGTMIIPIDPQKAQPEIESILENHPDITVLWEGDRNISLATEKTDISLLEQLILGIDIQKPYMITYTSGSTGQAKGVIHSLQNLFLAGDVFGEEVGFSEKSRVCHTMPMTYMAGILNTIFMPLVRESQIVIFPRFSVMTAVTFWREVEKHGVNTFWLSPSMLNILMTVDRKGKAAGYLKSTETIFCIGTAPLFPQVKQAFEERYGVELLPSYGLSETLFISTKVKGEHAESNSVGKVLPMVNLHFSDAEEIYLDVPWMFLGYSNEKTSDYFEGKYYLSGDLGCITNQELYITGRKKDLIIRGGMNISPKQIEEVLLQSEEVAECCVSSVVRDNEERIICWCKTAGKAEIQGNALNAMVIERLGMAFKVDKFVLVDDIPKNLNGKVDKERLKKGFIDDNQI
ncbi:MAG: acyl--CoA ligase [Lachnospiraceae bacterium]|nr:acyl--CoA ligase [Lachnospiraceae bacterium]